MTPRQRDQYLALMLRLDDIRRRLAESVKSDAPVTQESRTAMIEVALELKRVAEEER